MDGDIAKQQRELGAGYNISFGVAVPHLLQISQGLPRSRELAEIMWKKEVREMKLLALLIYPTEELTKEMALHLIEEAPTQEVAEQLVMRQLRHTPFLRELTLHLFLQKPSSQASVVTTRYLLLGHAARQGSLNPEELRALQPILLQDLQSSNLLLLSTINNTLIRLAEIPGLHDTMRNIATIAYEVTDEGLPGKHIAEQLMHYLLNNDN